MTVGRRIPYAGSVHDQREVDAVVAVLEAGPQALRIGKNVREFESEIAACLENAVVSCAIQGHLPCIWRSSC